MIMEIWRKGVAPGLPICFTRGKQPQFLSDAGTMSAVVESPAIKSINYYETGAFSGKAFRGPCYVIQFEDSNMRRIIPAEEVKDIGWVVPESKVTAAPALEA